MHKQILFCFSFFIVLGIIIPFSNYAQNLKIKSDTRLVQNNYKSIQSSEVSKSIFTIKASNGITYNAVQNYSDYNFLTEPSTILGPGTPHDAIFCRFENTLWKKFDIGIRLRVENPPKDY